MKVRFKNLGNATLPQYAKPGDAGMDLVATSKEKQKGGIAEYGTDLAVEIPEGYVGLIFPRSSVYKYELALTNCVGVIDSGYRGEIKFKFRNTDWTGEDNRTYDVGDRIGQLIILPYPIIEPEWADELSDTVRGTGGWGSTGA